MREKFWQTEEVLLLVPGADESSSCSTCKERHKVGRQSLPRVISQAARLLQGFFNLS